MAPKFFASAVIFISAIFAAPASAYKLDVKFDELQNCEGKFDYQKVFLLEGRGPSDILAKDSEATNLIAHIRFGGRTLRPVSEAYSVPLFENYIHYQWYQARVERMAVALVEKADPGDGSGFDYELVLVAVAGKAKGTVLNQGLANYHSEQAKLDSGRFSCWK